MRYFPPPRALTVSWLALLGLLALTVITAYQPLGAFNTVVALTIALTKAAIVAAVFMELRRNDGLIIAFASAGFFWLAVLFWLALIDFLTRPTFPPRLLPLL
jgi:cytochrome c oxidase subunit 4